MCGGRVWASSPWFSSFLPRYVIVYLYPLTDDLSHDDKFLNFCIFVFLNPLFTV